MIEQVRRWIAEAVRQHLARDHAQRVTGKVTAVDATAKRCNVQIAGEAAATTSIPYCIDLPVAVNDDVYIDRMGSSYLVIGRAKLVAP